jgi:hypothetical protein
MRSPSDAESPPPRSLRSWRRAASKPGLRRLGLSAEGVAELTLRLRVPGRFGELPSCRGFPLPLTPDRKVRLGR